MTRAKSIKSTITQDERKFRSQTKHNLQLWKVFLLVLLEKIHPLEPFNKDSLINMTSSLNTAKSKLVCLMYYKIYSLTSKNRLITRAEE